MGGTAEGLAQREWRAQECAFPRGPGPAFLRARQRLGEPRQGLSQ